MIFFCFQILFDYFDDKKKIHIKDEAPVGVNEFAGYRAAEIAACEVATCTTFEVVPEHD